MGHKLIIDLSLAQYVLLVIVRQLLEETVLLCSFDHLVLLHLCHTFLLVAVSLAKHSADTEGITRPTTILSIVVSVEIPRVILVLAIALH